MNIIQTEEGSTATQEQSLEPAQSGGVVSRAKALPKWGLLGLFMLLIGSLFTSVGEVPENWIVGPKVARAVDVTVDWMVVNWDPFFSAVNIIVLRSLLLPLERFLLSLPWWLIVGVVGLAAYRIVGVGFGLLATGMVLVLVFFGLADHAMTSLAIVLTSTVLAVAIGVPTGIAAAKSTRFDAMLKPVLDTMQTMPSFVYLIPVLMLFGLGKVPAVIAVVIYAVAPIIRLTNLGIRQVDSDIVEVARAFGTTPIQLLVKVQFPLAMPTIMAGLNQTIMMALAMVVIASMIGARGLGTEVLNGIARLDIGRGLLGGIGIVIMAIILDRITQALGKPRRTARAQAQQAPSIPGK